MTTHIMLDLETMGKGSNAAIVSIGAVEFNPSSGVLGCTGQAFEAVINLNSSAYYGEMDASTVQWWLQQSDEARHIFNKDVNKIPLKTALNMFNEWLCCFTDKANIQIWGNGSGFDNVILANAFKACRIKPDFSHWNDRDVRTIVEMGRSILGINPKETLTRKGVHHSALDDAKFQAQYVSAIWRTFEQRGIEEPEE